MIETTAQQPPAAASPAGPTKAKGREPALRQLFGAAAACLGVVWLGLLLAVQWRYRAADLPETMRASLCLAQTLGLAALVYSLLARRIAAALGLAIVALLGASIGAFGLLLALGFDPVAAMERAYIKAASPAWKPLELWQYDDRFGYRLRPGTSARHEHIDFDVTYTIDETGHRTTPASANPRGEILITGCSFTFGYGLEDDETFAARLATGAWSDYRIVNAGVVGWGTAHALLTIEERLQSEPRPELVLYAMIPQHVERNYIRRSWLNNLLTHPAQRTMTGDPQLDRRGQPHFEMEHGELVYQGVASLDQAVDDAPGLYEKELNLTCAMLAKMQSQCAEANVPFVLVLLPTRQNAPWPHKILATCGAHGIDYLDLSRLPFEGFPHNQHPNAADHRRIATAIADSFVSDRLAEPSRTEEEAR